MLSPSTTAAGPSGQYDEGLASLPKGVPEQATMMENPDDIKVIHFGVV